MDNNYKCALDVINVMSYIIGIENLRKNDEQINALEKHLSEQDRQYEEIIKLLKKEDIMRYRSYGNTYTKDVYGRDNYGRDNYGRDNYGRGNYGRNNYGSTVIGNYGRMRDSQGRFMGEDELTQKMEETMDKMYEGYQAYSEGKNMYGHGSSAHKEATMESLNYMLESVVDFIAMLKKDAGSQEELDLIKRYSQTLSEM